MTRRAVTVLLAVAIAALLLTACGGGPSRDDYEVGLARVQEQLRDAEKASLEANGADAEGRQAALGSAQQSIAAAAKTADELEPPDDVAQAHGRFVAALEDYADLFEQLATIEPNDERQTELYGEANELVKRLSDASRAIEKAGYEVAKGDS